MLTMDSNEPKDLETELRSAGLPISREKLEIGDYIIGNILIERKESKDFLASIYDNRLFNQLHRMEDDLVDHRLLIAIYGPIPPTQKWMRVNNKTIKISLSEDEKARRERTIISAISTIILSYQKVSIVLLKDKEQFISMLIDLYYRQTQRTPSTKPVVKITSESPRDIKWAILSQLPGVGSKGANVMCDSGLSIQEICSMSPDDIKNTFDGIGDKRSKAIYDILHYKGESND